MADVSLKWHQLAKGKLLTYEEDITPTWHSTPRDDMNMVTHLGTGGTGRLKPRSRRRDACRAPSKDWDLGAAGLAWSLGPAASS